MPTLKDIANTVPEAINNENSPFSSYERTVIAAGHYQPPTNQTYEYFVSADNLMSIACKMRRANFSKSRADAIEDAFDYLIRDYPMARVGEVINFRQIGMYGAFCYIYDMEV